MAAVLPGMQPAAAPDRASRRGIVKNVLSAPSAAAAGVRRRLMPAHDIGLIAGRCQREDNMNTPDVVSVASLLAKEGPGARKQPLKTQLDAIQDDEQAEREFEENLWKYSRLLTERGKFKQRWDPFIQLLVVYNCLFIPMSLSFAYQLAPNHQLADYAIDLLFIVDMLVSISTVYYNQHFELVIERKKIAYHYLTTWFVIDLFSILPLELFANLITGDEADRLIVADFLKLPRMLRLARFRRRADQTKSGANLLRMVILCVLFLFLAHLVACLWWAIGRMGLPGVDAGVDGHSTAWILRMEARDGTLLLARNETAEALFVALLDDGTNDVGVGGNDAADLASAIRADDGHLEPWHAPRAQTLIPGQYLTSLYWALTALLKTPSIGPDTPLEKLFATAVTIFGVLVFTFFVGNTIEVLQAVSQTDEARRKQMKALSDFVRVNRNAVSRSLRLRIFAHSAAEYRATLGINTSAILHQFPRSLRGQIVVYMHRQTLQTCELFGALSVECTKALLLCVTPTVCLQKQVLLGKGELCEYLYILQRGAMQVRDQDAADFEDDEPGGDKENAFELTRKVIKKVKRASCQALYSLGLPVMAPGTASPASQRRGAPTPSQRRSPSPSRRGRMEFHVVERQGALLGLRDTHDLSMIYPYTVIASKTAALLRITAADLRTVVTAFGGQDEEGAHAILLQEFDAIAASMLHGTKKQRRASVEQLKNQLGGSFVSPTGAGREASRAGFISPAGGAMRGGLSPLSPPQSAAHAALERAAQKSQYVPGGDWGDESPAKGDGGRGGRQSAPAATGMSIEQQLSQGRQPHGGDGGSGVLQPSPASPEPHGQQHGHRPPFGSGATAVLSPQAPTPPPSGPSPLREGIGSGGGDGSSFTEGGSSGGADLTPRTKPELATHGERKNSLALSGGASLAVEAVGSGGSSGDAVAHSREDLRKQEEERKWQEEMGDLRQEVASAGRKLQSLLSAMAAVEAELALIPQVARAIETLAAVSKGGSTGGAASRDDAQSGEQVGLDPDQRPSSAAGGAGFFGWFKGPPAPPPSVPPSPAAAEVVPSEEPPPRQQRVSQRLSSRIKQMARGSPDRLISRGSYGVLGHNAREESIKLDCGWRHEAHAAWRGGGGGGERRGAPESPPKAATAKKKKEVSFRFSRMTRASSRGSSSRGSSRGTSHADETDLIPPHGRKLSNGEITPIQA